MFMPPPPFAYIPQQQRPPPTMPIIESIYDTYPRHREDAYGGTLPPNSTYKPGTNYDYEGFYETYRRSGKANGEMNSDSDTSVEDSAFWASISSRLEDNSF